jgi:hypothetical protein
VLAVAALVVGPATAGSSGPDPKLMALTQDDVGYVATVESEGRTTSGPIAATRGYRRTFSGLTPGSVQLLTVEDTVLLGKAPGAAAKLIAARLLASRSQSGRDKLYADAAKAFTVSSGLAVTKGAVVRAGAVKAGDGAVEAVFRFVTPGGAFQVGELYVRVGGTLSAISSNGAMPGLSAVTTRQFALAAAAHMKQVVRTS